MQTHMWSTGFANNKTTKNGVNINPNPDKFAGGILHSIASSKKTYLIITITLVMAGVLFLVLKASAASGNNNNTNSTTSNSGSTQNGSDSSSKGSSSASNPTGGAQNGNSSSTSVKVNGQFVDVPQSGAYNKTVKVPGGQVQVSGDSTQSSTGSSSTNKSSTNVDVQVHH